MWNCSLLYNIFVPMDGWTERLAFGYIHWFQKVYCQKSISSVASIWCHKRFELEGPACFIPVQRLTGKGICAKINTKNQGNVSCRALHTTVALVIFVQ